MVRIGAGEHTGLEALAIAAIDVGLILLNPIDPGPHLFAPQDEIAGGALIFLGATGYAMLQLFPTEGKFHEYSHLGGVPGDGTSIPGIEMPGAGAAAAVPGVRSDYSGFSTVERLMGYGFGFLASDIVDSSDDEILIF